MSDTRTPEAQLAQDILDRVTEHPDQLNMETWWRGMDGPGVIEAGTEVECGTTMCIAGWAAHLAGWTLIMRQEYDGPLFVGMAPAAVKGGQEYDLETVAVKALGLRNGALFHMQETPALAGLRMLAAGRPLAFTAGGEW